MNTKVEKKVECKKECEVYARIVGFYRPTKNWNKGKKEEFKIRVNYKLNMEASHGFCY